MDRVYVGPIEPKGPKKPPLWIKNDSVDGIAIYINVGNSYVKYNHGDGQSNLLVVNINYDGGEGIGSDTSVDDVINAHKENKLIKFVIHDSISDTFVDEYSTTEYLYLKSREDENDQYEYLMANVVLPYDLVDDGKFCSFVFAKINGNDNKFYLSREIANKLDSCDFSAINITDDFGHSCASVSVDNSTIKINENNQIYVDTNNI